LPPLVFGQGKAQQLEEQLDEATVATNVASTRFTNMLKTIKQIRGALRLKEVSCAWEPLPKVPLLPHSLRVWFFFIGQANKVVEVKALETEQEELSTLLQDTTLKEAARLEAAAAEAKATVEAEVGMTACFL
jgi:hypothetical protein